MSTNQISTPFKDSNAEQDKIKLKDWIIMVYGSMPYVGMAPKKMAATLKVRK